MATILDAFGRPFSSDSDSSRGSAKDLQRAYAARQSSTVQARYDAAEMTPDNMRHWRMADGLSADAANSAGVRRILRNRARHEIFNNSYLRGMTRTLANDVIGSGPRLQIHHNDKAIAAQVEALFALWSMMIRLGPKMRTMRLAQCQDGEGISVIKNNGGLPGIQLDLQPIEAEMLTTPFLQPLQLNQVDGLEFDEWGNVVAYNILKRHPGDTFSYSATMEHDTLAASYVSHIFHVERPGQHRGLPEIMSSLPLGAMMRRYTLAVVQAAETAANLSAIMETAGAVDDPAESDDDPFTTIEMERGMLMRLPEGWKINQLKAEQPTSLYGDFKTHLLCEQARPLSMPKNIALGDSSGYNYSSGRLDHQVYYKTCDMDRSDYELMLLEPLLRMWIREARLLGLIPRGLTYEMLQHTWQWDPYEDIDPAKTADAIERELRLGLTTLPREYAKRGLDFERELEKQAKALAMTTEALRARIADVIYSTAARPVAPQPEGAPNARQAA